LRWRQLLVLLGLAEHEKLMHTATAEGVGMLSDHATEMAVQSKIAPSKLLTPHKLYALKEGIHHGHGRGTGK
jgi:hypothetical protein